MKTRIHLTTPASTRWLALSAGLIVLALMSTAALAAAAPGDGTEWTPASSERLVKLPASYLKKAVEQDFARSGLAASLSDTDNMVRLKVQTLEDLRDAIDRADGALRIELRHQFLGEKRAYLKLIAAHQDLRRQRAKIKIRLYRRLLGKLERNRGRMTPRRVALIAKQEQAVLRFEASIAKVDTKLFRSSLTTESRYAREYARNIGAIERLVEAINFHPMNEQARLDGTPVDKPGFIRHLMGEEEAELAILGQEQTVLGFMAKLISLDALALSDAVTGDDPAAMEPAGPDHALTAAVDYFVTR